MINSIEIQSQLNSNPSRLRQQTAGVSTAAGTQSNLESDELSTLNSSQITQGAEPSSELESESSNEEPFAPETMQTLLEAQEQSAANSALSIELTPEEELVVQDLKQRDREVRAHEQAHKNVGGAYTGAISYTTTTGPDGRAYAIGGEVQIDSSPIPNNPEATIRKMRIVERAALAPAEPSPQDIQVARQAQAQRLQAQQELRTLQADENTNNDSNPLFISPIEENIEAATQTSSSSEIEQIISAADN